MRKVNLCEVQKRLTNPAYDFKTLLEIVPIAKTSIYKEIKAGRLKPTYMGVKVLFLADDILDWLGILASKGTPNEEEECNAKLA